MFLISQYCYQYYILVLSVTLKTNSLQIVDTYLGTQNTCECFPILKLMSQGSILCLIAYFIEVCAFCYIPFQRYPTVHKYLGTIQEKKIFHLESK